MIDDSEREENKALAEENLCIEIEADLKKYGCYDGMNGVEITKADWELIQQESISTEAAFQEAFDTVLALYKKR